MPAAPQNSDATPIRALIADDERLLREQLRSRLSEAWPDLQICGMARDGFEALRMAEELRPDIVFLDIRMPGLSGMEAAREIVALEDWSGQLVFVTAYDEYAISAFEAGAIDYLLKPAETARLKITMDRVLARLHLRTANQKSAGDAGASYSETMLQTLLTVQRQLNGQQAQPRLRWLQCSAGQTTRMVAVEDILFFRSDEKYTRVQTLAQEFLIRTPIRELVPQLDEQQFWQIHRSTIVNVGEIAAVHRDDMGKQRVSLKHHTERLEVSRSFSHLFKHQ
jgi:DNA-binding LytR/AlgR family response regulator